MRGGGGGGGRAGPAGPAGLRGQRALDLLSFALIATALAFSAYCALHVSWAAVDATGPAAAAAGGSGAAAGARKLVASGGRAHVVIEAGGLGGGSGSSGSSSGAAASSSPCSTEHAAVQVVTGGASMRNPRKYHLVTTCQGFSNHWQARIHYYWYKKQRSICEEAGPSCDMGGFTRLLHSGEADDLMEEIPTVVVDPLPKEIMKDSSYVVLNRPYAFLEWLKRVSIPEKYLIMGEGDHLWIRPMPNMMVGEGVGAALFSYMTPDKYPEIVRKFVGPVSDDEVKKVPQIGNSPTMLSVKAFRKMAPVWYNTTMAIFNDEEAHAAWSWVLEMYGYTLSTYITGEHEGLTAYTQMLAHPPFDAKEVDYKGDPFYLIHLTYPMRFNKTGGMTDKEEDTVWMFDKRKFMDAPPPRNLAPPPDNVDNTLVKMVIAMMNEATDSIPCWDKYVTDKVVTTTC